ncbi:hypothetical protein Tco_0341628 [Tanacetum coccineum]
MAKCSKVERVCLAEDSTRNDCRWRKTGYATGNRVQIYGNAWRKDASLDNFELYSFRAAFSNGAFKIFAETLNASPTIGRQGKLYTANNNGSAAVELAGRCGKHCGGFKKGRTLMNRGDLRVRDIGEFWKVYTQYGFAFSGFAVVVVRCVREKGGYVNRTSRSGRYEGGVEKCEAIERRRERFSSNKRVLKVNGLPPISFMHSPPRPNPKWYTILLDKRLDHDGGGIKEAQINDTYVGADVGMATFVAIVMDNHYPRLELTLSSRKLQWHLKAANETGKEGKSNVVINDNEHFLKKVAVVADEVGILDKASQKQALSTTSAAVGRMVSKR